MKKAFITLIALLLSLAASAAVQYNGLWYNLNTNDNTAEVVASQGAQYSGKISIQTWVYYQNTSYKVTSIGNSAFEGCVDVTSVSIPSSVTSIGNGAFWQCSSLKSVYIPDGVKTIGEGAFHNCFNLVSVFIPSSVTSIGSSAFSNCNNLTQVFSLIQNPFSINNNVFTTYSTTTLFTPKGTKSAYLAKSGWKEFTTINDEQKRTINVATAGTLPNLISENEMYYIEELTLSGELNGTDIRFIRNMSGIDYDSKYHSIYTGPFHYFNISTPGILKILDISDTKIVGGGDWYYAETHDGGDIENEYGTGNNIISTYMFYGCKLTSIRIPNSVTSIYDDAFSSCISLTSLTIPNSVTSIGKNAFACCISLTSITIPNSVTSIGWSAFGGCTGLTSITIPNSVTTIGSSAFDGTGWYNNQPNGLVYAGNVAYRYKGTMPNNTSITIKDGTVGIAGSAFSGCSGLTSITIPNSVANIGEWAFYSCNELSSLLIPSSVTSIGGSAFNGCEDLVRIVSSSKIPPTCESGAFSSKAYCTVWVPMGCREAYLKANEWKDFKEIKEIDGDINLDGKVNKADIDALVTYIMHGTPAIYGTIADLNNDEKVNTADVVMLVNLLNNGGLSTEFQPYFGNDNGNSVVTSIVCTLNNDRKEAIQLTKCELYCNNSLVSYKSYSGGSSSTVAAGGSKDCSFTGLSMLANSSNFSVVWYYTYNGESYTYRCDLTE